MPDRRGNEFGGCGAIRFSTKCHKRISLDSVVFETQNGGSFDKNTTDDLGPVGSSHSPLGGSAKTPHSDGSPAD